MHRIDTNYLYLVGSQLHPISEFRVYPSGGPVTTYESARLPLYYAEAALEPLLTRSVFGLRTSFQSGQALLIAIRTLKVKIDGMTAVEMGATLDFFDAYSVTSALTAFETVLAAELALLPSYIVQPKAGYDTAVLIDAGHFCFPTDLMAKVPEAIPDLQQATKCLAFEVLTAAGFHLHRANEIILRKYWDVVSGGKPAPQSRTIGAFLHEMDNLQIGDPKVKAAMRDLKDLHRNPLIHPQDTIAEVHEAVALMNNVHVLIVNMLREIPVVAPKSALPPVGSIVTTPTSPAPP